MEKYPIRPCCQAGREILLRRNLTEAHLFIIPGSHVRVSGHIPQCRAELILTIVKYVFADWKTLAIRVFSRFYSSVA